MDARADFSVATVRILGLDEIPFGAAVADRATGLPAGK